MITIIHKIKLINQDFAQQFENWVRDTDYEAAPYFKSLISFNVFKNSNLEDDNFDYFEVIQISDLELFEKDMETERFASLVAAFSKMANVVEEITGHFMAPGYHI